MPTRQRIRTSIRKVGGGGGGGPSPGGTISWGPSFGQSSGDDDSSWDATAAIDLDKIAIVGNLSATQAVTMPEIGITGNTTAASSLTGTALGAPFWQNVSTVAYTTNTSTIVINKPTGTVEGELLVAFILHQGLSAATFTPPSGWTLVRQGNAGTGTITTCACYYKVAGASEPSSYSFGSSINGVPASGEINRYRGVDPTTPINVSAIATLAASSLDPDPDTPSVTTTVANCLVVSWIGHDHGVLTQSHTLPANHIETSDFESIQSAGAGLIAASNAGYKVFSAAGATGTVEHNCTESVATAAVMIRVAIAPGPLVLA